MNYYEVLVGDMHYHGKTALTYSSDVELMPGSVVRIALRERAVLGIVLGSVPEPSFKAKPIAAAAPAQPLPAESLQLIDWLYVYYPASFGAVIRQFLPPSVAFPKLGKATIDEKSAVHPSSLGTLPSLTQDQTKALQLIKATGYHLLHGITGSGKTRVYIELCKRALASGRSTIILTPEIGLTAQLVESFADVFSEKVYVLHSRKTAAERRDIWYGLLSSDQPVIVIGSRSALFAPLKNIGLIVIDEAHDSAYKNETAPNYRTERVAAKLAELHGACLVSGSATPAVEEYYVASAKQRPIINLRRLAKYEAGAQNPVTNTVVDMRDRGNFTRSNILSTPLINNIQSALGNREQTLLFLNRRGTASAVLCNNCGWQALCEHCDLPFIYHGDTHIIRCHVCGRKHPLPSSCPDCGHTDILLKTVGTKAVVDDVQRIFPDARVQRFDSDVVEKADQIEQQLDNLQTGKADIIVGTQMITKGLDLPKLSVVGILSADSSLLIPDYTAEERTYQLLAQVMGRTGRGHRAGSVVVQTYNPTHPVIRASVAQDWQSFYEQELSQRRTFRFPPFTFLLKLSCARATSTSAEKSATKLKQQIEKDHPRLIIEGPAPAFHPREGGKYKWQLIAKSSSRTSLTDLISTLPSGWQHDIDPVNLL